MARETVDCVMRAASAGLSAEQGDGALGVREQVGNLLHDVGVADEVGRSAIFAAHAVILRITNFGGVDFAIHDVVRNFEKTRARRAVEHLAKRDAHHFRHALGSHHERREFADGRHHFGVAQFLQSAHAVLLERGIAADQEHRALGAEGVGHAGDGVGGAGAGGYDRAAEAGDARVGVGRMRGNLLVADVDDLDPFVDASVIDVDDVAAGNGEDVPDAFLLQHFGDDLATGNHFNCGGGGSRIGRGRGRS